MGEAAEILEVPPSAKTLGSLPPPAVTGPVAEVCSLPARWLFDLPEPVELALHVPGIPEVVRIDLDGEREEDESLWLDADEWVALAVGAEADRAWAPDLRAWLERKQAEPSFRLSAELTLAGAQPDRDETWSVGRVLRRLGATLLSVDA